MNRRGFLRRLMIAAVAAPVAAPVVMKVAKEVATTVKPSYVAPFKGAQFMETGIVYAPYIPLIQTCEIINQPINQRIRKLKTTWQSNSDPLLEQYLNETVEKYWKQFQINA